MGKRVASRILAFQFKRFWPTVDWRRRGPVSPPHVMMNRSEKSLGVNDFVIRFTCYQTNDLKKIFLSKRSVLYSLHLSFFARNRNENLSLV